MTMLKLENIQTYYGDSHILHGISLEVPEKKCVVLLGRNGAGKTTTLRSIMGLTPAREGKIIFQDQEIQDLPSHKISRMGCGYCPQGRRLFKSLTVREHLQVYWRHGSNGESEWTPEKALDVFPRLKERLDNKGDELSGGEQQMLAIARALVTNPRLLILDEPTEGLAPLIVREVGKLINIVKESGLSILLTEQKLRFALDLADDVYLISSGQIVYHNLPEKLEKDEETKSLYLGV